MANLTEIRWHGRGGQGAKTASVLLGKVIARTNKSIQAFPEYGPERMGAPVLAFNRISDEQIRIHCKVTEPDIVMALDPSLLDIVEITAGTSSENIIVVNTTEAPEVIKEKTNFAGKIYTVNAYKIAREEMGRPIPNTPMLGALVKVTDLLEIEDLLKYIKVELNKKFADKLEIVDKNITAIKRSYREVS